MTTATYKTSFAGNAALESHAWTIPTDDAKRVVAVMKDLKACTPGSYWQAVVVKPVNRAIRAKAETVRVFTAGFSTSQLANWLFLAKVKYVAE